MAKIENKKSNFSLRRLIYNDKYLIIISLILAVIIWIVASINIGTDETKTIKLNVPITLGDEISEQYGMQYYSIQDNIDLSVTISGPKYVIGQVTENDLSVNFDSSSVTRTGAQTIPILVSNDSRNLDFDVTNTYPSTLDAFFDVNETKTFNVDVEFDSDKVADGYVFGNPIVSEETVVVSGPQTYVDKIESVYTTVDFDGQKDLTKQFKTDCNLQVKGLGAETNYLSITSKGDIENKLSSVSVTVPVLKESVLPVAVDFEGEPKNNNNMVTVRYSVNQLNVGILGGANIKSAVVGTIDYSQLKPGRNSFEFDVSNLKGITVLDDNSTVYVDVYVSGALSEHRVNASKININVEGLPNGKKAKVVGLDNAVVSVMAPKNTSINPNVISIVVDVSKKNNNNLYPAQFEINSKDTAWVYGQYNVEVEIE